MSTIQNRFNRLSQEERDSRRNREELNQVKLEHWKSDNATMTDRHSWIFLGDIWANQIGGTTEPDWWREAFTSGRPERRHLMTFDEQNLLETLPDRLRVYRGYAGESHDWNGLSWSLNRNVAQWFALTNYWTKGAEYGSPRIAAATIRKCEVIGLINRRGEAEVIIDPSSIDQKSMELQQVKRPWRKPSNQCPTGPEVTPLAA